MVSFGPSTTPLNKLVVSSVVGSFRKFLGSVLEVFGRFWGVFFVCSGEFLEFLGSFFFEENTPIKSLGISIPLPGRSWNSAGRGLVTLG